MLPSKCTSSKAALRTTSPRYDSRMRAAFELVHFLNPCSRVIHIPSLFLTYNSRDAFPNENSFCAQVRAKWIFLNPISRDAFQKSRDAFPNANSFCAQVRAKWISLNRFFMFFNRPSRHLTQEIDFLGSTIMKFSRSFMDSEPSDNFL